MAYAETSEELFKKVFGKDQESKRINLDVTMEEFFLGSVRATVSGEKILTLSGADLELLLKNKIKSTSKAFYSFGDKDIDATTLPFKVIYLSSELRMKIEIPVKDLEPRSANIYDDMVPYFAKKAVGPAPFSIGTNYKLEDVQVSKLDQKDSFSSQIDSFMNIKSVTVENQMNYLSTRESAWYRQNSRLTYDSPDRMQRLEMGDVTFPILGYQKNRQVGGVSFYKDFSLNPYRVSAPTSSFEYEIVTRSLVRTYINGAVIKTEYMNPGHYSVKDIPLNNGLNKIVVEVIDEFGKKNLLIFNEASSIDSLASGLSRYSLTAGLPSTDNDTEKKYDEKDGAFYSTFYQYGLSKHWSGGAYAQGNNKFTMIGIDNIWATNFGNWSIDTVGTQNKEHSGPAIQGNYQLNLFGTQWYDSHTVNARVEYRSPWISESGENVLNRFDYLANGSYGVPFLERFNITLGGNYQHPRFGDNSKFGIDTSLSTKIFNSSSITIFYGRARDENKIWSTQMYCFLNFTFGESSSFASGFYDKNSDTKRLTIINDNGKKLNSLKSSASIDDSSTNRNGSIDLQYNTALADVGVREDVSNTKGLLTGSRTSFRFLSAVAYVKDGDHSQFAISRPISNSYAIFKPSEGWTGQRFGVQSSSGDNDTETGLFGESLLSGLGSYQYRRLQLDPSNLEPGYSLGQESFVVFPRYRSGHIFVIGKKGMLVLKGILLDKFQKPIALKVGYLTTKSGQSTAFFTGRDGEFLIEGAEASVGRIQLDDDQFEAKELDLAGKKSGVVDMGNVVMPYIEGRL
jgi:outer membrane usher protein